MFDNDCTITGKHAKYMKILGKNTDDNNFKIFERLIDVYMNAAIFGLLYSRKSERDKDSKDSNDKASILASTFANERRKCTFLYSMVLLLDNSSKLEKKERINRALQYDIQSEKKEEFNQNMELFHKYVRGGIEIMYELFTNNCYTEDDYLERVYDIMTKFREDIENNSCEKILSLIKPDHVN